MSTHKGRIETQIAYNTLDMLRKACNGGQLDEIKIKSSVYTQRHTVSELRWALIGACEYGQLGVAQWLVKHTALRTDVSGLSDAMISTC